MAWRLTVALLLLAVSASAEDKVERLIGQLRSPHAQVRRDAAESLGYMGPGAAKAVAALVAGLRDRDVRVGSAAWDALRSIGDVAFPHVLGGASSSNPSVRRDCSRLLAGYSATYTPRRKQIRAMVHMLGHRHKDEAFAENIAVALGNCGAAAVPALVRLLRRSQESLRRLVILALRRIGARSVAAVHGALDHDSATARAAAARCLGLLGTRSTAAVPRLIELLSDNVVDVRVRSAIALGQIGHATPKAVSALILMLTDEAKDARGAAKAALVGFEVDAVASLVEALGDAQRVVTVREVIYEIGRPAMPSLSKALGSNRTVLRIEALGLLQRLAHFIGPETVLAVVARIGDTDKSVGGAALACLGALSSVQHKPYRNRFLQLATSPESELRWGAVRGLGNLGRNNESVRAVLDVARKDAVGKIRVAAAYASWQIGYDVTQALVEMRTALTGADIPAKREAVAAVRGLGPNALATTNEIAAVAGDTEAPLDLRLAAVRALGSSAVCGVDLFRGRASRFERSDKPVADATRKAQAWLAAKQAKGRWSCGAHGGRPGYDIGVTALALQSLMATGMDGKHRDAIRAGLAWLISTQQVNGLMGSRAVPNYTTQHGVATCALAEAWILTGSNLYGRVVRRAVRYIEWSRNPGLAWKYTERSGKNDTEVTAWMVTALRFAEFGALPVDQAAFEGARRWISAITDPEFGMVGYDLPGGSPARPKGLEDRFPPERSQSMTAAGLWIRQLLGVETFPDDNPKQMSMRSIDLILEYPAEWNRENGSIDLYYWFYGAQALNQTKLRFRRKWMKRLRTALLSGQRDNGSWPAIGVWGSEGGTVYATSMATLALLADVRIQTLGLVLRRPQGHVKDAQESLKTLKGDADHQIATEAKRQLQRLAR